MRHREWWRSAEAHEVYWGAWDEPLSHGLFTPEGLPQGRRPGGWYYAPQIDTPTATGLLAALKRDGDLSEVRRFATEWRRWRRTWGTTPAKRKARGQIKLGLQYVPQSDVYAPAAAIALLLKKPPRLHRGPHDTGPRRR